MNLFMTLFTPVILLGIRVATTLSDLDLCNRKLVKVQTWHRFSNLVLLGTVVLCSDPGATFDLDPLNLNVKNLVKVDFKLFRASFM